MSQVNSDVEGSGQKPAMGLKVIIVGSGIGGLSAAIALRQQGHLVEVYESSSFSREIGAALHTAPNGNAILKPLGISCKDLGANILEYLTAWTSEGIKVKTTDLAESTKIFEHKWRMAHRVKLHEALRQIAIAEAGTGKPATLHVSKAAVDVDTENAIVYFKDGTSAKGDVVIGADGVHSVTRTKLPEGNMQPFPSGQSAFRFLIPKDVIMEDPRTRRWAEEDGTLQGIFALDRNIIMYPTNDNTVLNFVCIHPDADSGTSLGWGNSADHSQMFEVYKSFHPDVLALLGKANKESLKVWKLLDMDALPKWHHGRAAVIGDAAHPFMPFLGQGASVAIEDAVAIGVVLEAGLTRDEVPERLALYQRIRKERAELIQEYTRRSGSHRGKTKEFDVAQYQGYCFGHDEWHNSRQKLREWKWSKDSNTTKPYPTVFNPSARLRLLPSSSQHEYEGMTWKRATIKFNTSRTILDGFLPIDDKSFRFKSLGSIAQCTFQHTSIEQKSPQGGKVCNQIALYLHGVEYTTNDGKKLSGAFCPLVVGDVAERPAVDGEGQDIPMVMSEIRVESEATSYRIHTCVDGWTWGSFCFEGLASEKPPVMNTSARSLPDASQGDEGILAYEYSSFAPQTSTLNRQDSQHIKFTPHQSDTTNGGHPATQSPMKEGRDASQVFYATSAYFKFEGEAGRNSPSLGHIIPRLQEMTNLGIIEAKVVEGAGLPSLL